MRIPSHTKIQQIADRLSLAPKLRDDCFAMRERLQYLRDLEIQKVRRM